MRDTMLWKAIRSEVEMTLDAMGYIYEGSTLDLLTNDVIEDDYLWQQFNEGVLDIIMERLGKPN